MNAQVYEAPSHRLSFIGNNKLGRGFTMASLNINSLLAHIDELRLLVHDSNIDVLTINETKLDATVSDNDIHIPGYEVIRKDRNINGRNGGGVCIYIRTIIIGNGAI